MRKPLTKCLILSLSACFATPALVGCEEKSQEAQTADKLEALITKFKQVGEEGVSFEGNANKYNFQTTAEDGTVIPGAYSPSAAYVDQALALLPAAQEIAAQGNERQKKTAQAIIATILADEAALLISESISDFQDGLVEISQLREPIASVRQINETRTALDGERETLVNTIKIGSGSINDLLTQLTTMNADIQRQQTQLDEEVQSLNERIQGITVNKANERKLAKLNRRVAQLSGLVGQLGQLQERNIAAEKNLKAIVSLPPIDGLKQLNENLAKAQSASKDASEAINAAEAKYQALNKTAIDNEKLASDLESESRTVKGDAKLQKANAAITASADAQAAQADMWLLSNIRMPVLQNTKTLAELEVKVTTQIIDELNKKLDVIAKERAAVKKQLAELDKTRDEKIKKMTETFTRVDAELQARVFDRMQLSAEKLTEAESASELAKLGSQGALDQMSLYLLHAHALHQTGTMARSYMSTLKLLRTVGTGAISSELLQKIDARIAKLGSLLKNDDAEAFDIATAADALATASATTVTAAEGAFDAASPEGQRASKQIQLFSTLIQAIQTGKAPAVDPSPTGGGETNAGLLGTWKKISGEGPDIITFKADGTFDFDIEGPDGQKATITFKYAVDGGKITIYPPEDFGGQPETTDYQVDGDKFTTTGDDPDDNSEYVRVN